MLLELKDVTILFSTASARLASVHGLWWQYRFLYWQGTQQLLEREAGYSVHLWWTMGVVQLSFKAVKVALKIQMGDRSLMYQSGGTKMGGIGCTGKLNWRTGELKKLENVRTSSVFSSYGSWLNMACWVWVFAWYHTGLSTNKPEPAWLIAICCF